MPKSMLEKLTGHYWMMQKMGNGGYGTGYYNEDYGVTQRIYEFPKGKFVLQTIKDNFYRWYYKPNE